MKPFKLPLLTIFFAMVLGCFNLNAQPILPCGLNHSTHRKSHIAACMMFQNEARYIKEWIEYHKSIGIKHFYLYNNASTDRFWAILMPYVINGEVELFDLYDKSANVQEHNELQKKVYNHAVRMAKGNNEWLAIIDADEFICMTNQKSLRQFLKSYKNASGLVLNWVMYGSSGVEELAPNGLQIENFLFRAPDEWGEHFLFKSIVRPKHVASADIHDCKYLPGKHAVYANHQKFSHTPGFKRPPIDNIRINHYWWRDEKYFREVKRPRRLGWLSNYSEAEVEWRRAVYNSIYDPSMSSFVNQTKFGIADY